MGALMYQIHMKPEVVLLAGFGFRLDYLVFVKISP